MALNKQDTVGIIALSGNCDKEKVESSKKYFENLGYKVRFSKNIFEQNRYLAGSDEIKLEELHSFFSDNEIKLILCARGGYGAIRLINKIDYNLIKSNPKPFCGFSDVTALLLMLYKKCNLITYHSPMACTDFAGKINKNTKDSFFDAINGEKQTLEGETIYKEGNAKGILWGGNLSTVVSLCGQDFIPEEDFIFFAEDLNEPVYKIDKMFQQLLNIPKFKNNCKALALGDFSGVDNELCLAQYFEELAQRIQVPFVSGFKITHSEDKITIPVGKSATLQGKTININ